MSVSVFFYYYYYHATVAQKKKPDVQMSTRRSRNLKHMGLCLQRTGVFSTQKAGRRSG